MFDFEVQNGGLQASVLKSYTTYLASHVSASEATKLEELVTLRLPYVRPAYRADVKARKLAIINGSGTVHGGPVNLEREFCYAGTTAYPQ